MRFQGIARYVHLTKASAPKDFPDKLRYGLEVLIRGDDPQTATIRAQIEANKPADFSASSYVPLIECDGALAGYVALRARSSADYARPAFVKFGPNGMEEIIDPTADGNTVGKIVHVDVTFAGYSKGNGGVNCYLNGTAVTDADGPIDRELLSSGPSAQSLFGDLAGGPAPTAVPQGAAPTPAPAPAPVPAPVPAAPAPTLIMTAKANGASYESFVAQGWTDAMMVEQGYAVAPSFV